MFLCGVVHKVTLHLTIKVVKKVKDLVIHINEISISSSAMCKYNENIIDEKCAEKVYPGFIKKISTS